MIYWMIIGVNFHLFVICYDLLCHFPLKKNLFAVTEALFLVRCATASLVARMVNTNLGGTEALIEITSAFHVD